MCKRQLMILLAGIFLTAVTASPGLAQLNVNRRTEATESVRPNSRITIRIDPEAVAKAEECAEALRGKLFDLQIREIEQETRTAYCKS